MIRVGRRVVRRWAAALATLAVSVGVLSGCGTRTDGGITVSGREVDTQQTVSAGQSVRVTAHGTVDFGGGVAGIGALRLSADGEDGPTPRDAPAPQLRRNSLVVRIGDIYYQGGVDTTFVAASAGDVVLRANDPTPPTGSAGWDVQVQLGDRATTGGSSDAPDAPPAGFDRLPVSGDRVFTDLDVVAGSTVHLTSVGIVDFGHVADDDESSRLNADGNDGSAPTTYPAPNLRPNSLIAQIDGGPAWYQGGSDATFVPTTSGVLVLATNDDDVHDNTQSWFVSGRVTAPPDRSAPPVALGPFVVSNTTVDTGLTLARGQRVHVEARGRINLGGSENGGGDVVDDAAGDGKDNPTPPDYPAPALANNSLLVRVGSVYYQGGPSVDLTVREPGPVSLLANDVRPEDNRSVRNEDGLGWSVTITPSTAGDRTDEPPPTR